VAVKKMIPVTMTTRLFRIGVNIIGPNLPRALST